MRKLSIAMLMLALAGSAFATLPKPTPAEAEAQAAKKAAADAQAAKDKEALLAKMDALTAAWRAKAPSKGLKVNAPTPLPAPVAALTAPALQSAPSGQPQGVMTATGAAAPITSEKSGTAVASKDVKPAPSPPASTVKTK